MPVKIHQVSYFLALCEEGSFTRAAKRCGVAQPSLTRAIQQLEHELGGSLFERKYSTVRLTSLGHLVWPEFARIDQAVADVTYKVATFNTAGTTESNPKTSEGLMRAVAVTIMMLAIVAIGLTLRPTPSATAGAPEQAAAQIDPYGIQSRVDLRTLPKQEIADLF